MTRLPNPRRWVAGWLRDVVEASAAGRVPPGAVSTALRRALEAGLSRAEVATILERSCDPVLSAILSVDDASPNGPEPPPHDPQFPVN